MTKKNKAWQDVVVVVVSFVSLCRFDAMLEEQFSGLTFKVPHDVFPALWVEAGADEREHRDLLHLLFVSCRGRNTHTHKDKYTCYTSHIQANGAGETKHH